MPNCQTSHPERNFLRSRSNVNTVLLEVDADTAPVREAPDPETPFRIALLGDFSGRESRGVFESGAGQECVRAVLVDRDNFEEVLAQFHPEIKLPTGSGAGSSSLKFSELDDFHPDRLVEHAEMFRRLWETRSRLSNPATFVQAAEDLGLLSAQPATSRPESSPTAAALTQSASGIGKPTRCDR